MTTRMLIDARHQEETRVAVVKGNRIEEFDFEAAARKQIKGNIYLAKVTRVEPSLQAAFIDYGGNRHGFLAFSEIHPDYYQIPREDREALLQEEQRLVEEHAARDYPDDDVDESAIDDDNGSNADAGGTGDETGENGEPVHRPEEHGNTEEAGAEALRRRRMALRRRYKIQEVIRRRQVMLVQVVKEERGNKGAALTTYISLAGRYSVLMPNTAQGGGISRKIANAADRKRLKSIMSDLNLPSTMGAIVRTAGLERTKTEIKRDFDYLTRLWDEIREKTLTSTAPALIYEDSDLVKRAIRDIYSRDIDEVLVDGAEGYAHARSFMKLLIPSHARKVQPYNDLVPLFHRAGVESQLTALLNPVVNLKSGGYIVINPTEALVAIDVNSGRSTREYNIEETALKTNIEAAEEVARQLRLRDLAGLVVVDFIDMESNSNNRKVERALKEALKHDRARIQVGRISSFGLLEMSRQRLRTGVLEASTEVCSMCEGSGLVRTPGSASLAALRMLEEEAVRGRASIFRLRADQAVAVYMLNRKRAELSELEDRYGVTIEVVPDSSLIGARVAIDPSGPPPAQAPRVQTLATAIPVEDDIVDELEDEIEEEAEEREDREERSERGRGDREERGDRRRRRRRGGRGRERNDEARETNAPEGDAAEEPVDDQVEEAAEAVVAAAGELDGAEGEGRQSSRRRRRRRRRGGRRDGAEAVSGAEGESEAGYEAEAAVPEEAVAAEEVARGRAEAEVPASVAEPVDQAAAESAPESAPAKPKRVRKAPAKKTAKAEAAAAEDVAPPLAEAGKPAAEAEADESAPEVAPAKPKRVRKAPAKKAAKAETAAEEPAAEGSEIGESVAEAAPAKPKRVRKAPAKKAAKSDKPEQAAEDRPAAGAVAEQKAADAGAATAEAAETSAVVQASKPETGVEATGAAGDDDDGTGGTPRRGWWQRTFGN